MFNPHIKDGEMPAVIYVANEAMTRIVEICKWPDDNVAVWELDEQHMRLAKISYTVIADDAVIQELDSWLNDDFAGISN